MLVDLAEFTKEEPSARLSVRERRLLSAWATAAASHGLSYVEVIDWHIDGDEGRDLIRVIDARLDGPIVIYRPLRGRRFLVIEPTTPPIRRGAFDTLREALNAVRPVLPRFPG
jgi:hypothetical protein